MLEKLEAPKNAPLLGLALPELQAICSDLQRADLVPFERLTGRNAPVDGIWFPESGFISVLVRDHNGVETEVAMVGREGAVGRLSHSAIRGIDAQFVSQHRGVAHFVAAERVDAVLAKVPVLDHILAAATNALLYQIAGTAHANARGRVAQRLARWLLMAHDRIDADVLFVTHDILASMLGVRRVGVTNALHVLEGEQLVRAYRGRIRILDRAGLIAAAAGLYTPIERFPPRASGRPTTGVVDGNASIERQLGQPTGG